MTKLLPYLEQEALWRDIKAAFESDPDPTVFYGHVPHHQLLATPVRVFGCPSDPKLDGPATLDGGIDVAFTSYLGVSGRDLFRLDGCLYVDSKVRIADIRDGTSNTLLVGERPPSADDRFGWWYRGWGQNQDGSAEMVLGVEELNVALDGCPSGRDRFRQGSPEDPCDIFHFWSLHDGGAHFLFADGSARFLSYSSHEVMVALASRAGGEVSPDP